MSTVAWDRRALTFALLGLCALVLIGCAAKPVQRGESVAQQKRLDFPQPGQQVHAVKGGLVLLHADYVGQYRYRLTAPLMMRFILGRITISSDEPLLEAEIEGTRVFCTVRPTYFDPLIGPRSRTCLVPSGPNRFGEVRAAPGAVWFSKRLDSEVEYVSTETARPSSNPVLKRELIFEGAESSTLLFSERIYESSLTVPTRAKPLIVKADGPLPAVIEVAGARLRVVSVTPSTLTYEVEQSWR